MKSPRAKQQQGFTLIELMVVVVIISVVTSVSVLSLSGGDKSKLTAQQNQLKMLLSLVRDQSTFDRKLYLVVPDEAGLTTYIFAQNKWKKSPKVEFLAWKNGLTVQWSVDKVFAQKQQLPEPGWIFWPTGDVLQGDVSFSIGGDKFTAPKKENIVTVSWNDILQFDADETR
ncbi:MAG: prepilin-type N-terminal cleavage/methylation domain-containing protein [Thiomicrorhabdus sp.]|nr:prepilin-type N-terminal cleavage/methylation domain-containing protein [Thiomicrorhabdus sp.]